MRHDITNNSRNPSAHAWVTNGTCAGRCRPISSYSPVWTTPFVPFTARAGSVVPTTVAPLSSDWTGELPARAFLQTSGWCLTAGTFVSWVATGFILLLCRVFYYQCTYGLKRYFWAWLSGQQFRQYFVIHGQPLFNYFHISDHNT